MVEAHIPQINRASCSCLNCRFGLSSLSPRERDVMCLIASGMSNQAISEELHIRPSTVEQHINNGFSKLGVPSSPNRHPRVEAVLKYLWGTGVLSPPPDHVGRQDTEG